MPFVRFPLTNEPPHDKTNNVSMRPAKTQISLGIRPVWSESSLSTWRKLGSLATHWVHSEDSDQTGRMPRLIWVIPGRTSTLLVLSRGGSNIYNILSIIRKYRKSASHTTAAAIDAVKCSSLICLFLCHVPICDTRSMEGWIRLI